MSSTIEIQELNSNVCVIEVKKSSNEEPLHLFLETLKKHSILTDHYVFLHSGRMYDVTAASNQKL